MMGHVARGGHRSRARRRNWAASLAAASCGPGTGALSDTDLSDFDNNADTMLPASQANCSDAPDWAVLQSPRVTLENQNGKTPTLVWSL